MIWSCRCCAESSGCETGCPSYSYKACGAVAKRESHFKTGTVAKQVGTILSSTVPFIENKHHHMSWSGSHNTNHRHNHPSMYNWQAVTLLLLTKYPKNNPTGLFGLTLTAIWPWQPVGTSFPSSSMICDKKNGQMP